MALQRHERHGSDTVQQKVYGRRSLEQTHPLRAYLRADLAVLDVGCGPGTITADIAEAVPQGKIVGIDVEASAVERAASLVEERKLANLSFQVASAYELPFGDGTFDLVYAHHVLEWLRDPQAAVREAMRVTREHGVVAAQDVDYGAFFIHPPLPALEEWVRALEHFRRVEDVDLYGRYHFGRELFGLFIASGLIDVEVPRPVNVSTHQRKEGLASFREGVLLHLDLEGPYAALNQRMIEDGILSEQTLVTARHDLDQWCKEPSAFCNYLARVFVAGVVP